MFFLSRQIDGLSRASRFDEAQALIDEFERHHPPTYSVYSQCPFPTTECGVHSRFSSLVALLSGARNAMNIDLSKDMFDRMKKLFPHSTDPLVSASVLLANVYASSGDLEKASEIRRALGKSGWKKKVGKSWTAVHGQLFVSERRAMTSRETSVC